MRRSTVFRLVAAITAVLGFGSTTHLPAQASSHREAPLIAQDPEADNTDLYSFVSTNDAGVKVLNILSDFIGFEDPSGGPNYGAFASDVRYEIHVENDATMH